MKFFLQFFPEQLLTGIFFAVIISVVSFRFKLLSFSGSVATFLLATVIYGIGGWKWTVPILTFFIVSSLLSKFGKSRKKKFEIVFDKTDKRDAGQVAANGGVGGIIILIWYFFPERTALYYFYLASLAAVTADTWGTEIGTLWKGKPRSIISLKKVEPGTSGAISLQGIVGGIVGAFIVLLSVVAMNDSEFTVQVIAAIIFSGFVGSLADSILGATLQAQYQTSDGVLTEKKFANGEPTTFIRGFRWMNNDGVNWMCALAGALTMYLVM